MKLKFKFLITIIPYFFLFLILSAQNRLTWKGITQEVDGVTIVNNPKEPIHKKHVLLLKEELTIGGNEEKEEYRFSLIGFLEVNDQGDIYALDLKENHIKIFNKNGKYIKTFGRKGQGPGEMVRPKRLSLSNQNEVILVDINGISFFSLEGEFLRIISFSNFGKRVKFYNTDRNSNIYIYLLNSTKRRYELQQFDSAQKFIKTIEVSPLQNSRRDEWNPYYPELVYDIARDDRIICGYNNKYEIRIYNISCDLVMKIVKEYNPVKVTEKDVEEILKGGPPQLRHIVKMSKFYPPFLYFTSDDEGRLFVRTFEKVIKNEGFYYWDAFDKKGKYFAKVIIPTKGIPLFRNDKLYVISENEEGFLTIKRFGMGWNF